MTEDNITLHTAVEASRKNKVHFSTLVESSVDKIFLLNLDGKVTGVYGKWLDEMGLRRSDFIGHTLSDLFGNEIGAIHNSAISKALNGEFVVYEWDYENETRIVHLQESLSPIHDSLGNVTGLLSIGRDITKFKQIQDSLSRKAKHLEALYNSGRLLGRSLNLEENYAALHQSLRNTIPCDGLFISSYNPALNIIRCESAWMDGVQVDTSGFPELPLEAEGRGTQSVAIRSGNSIILNDYEASLRTAQSVHHVSTEGPMREEIPDDVERTRSAMIIPLKLEHEVLGVLQIFSYKLNAFTEEHLQFAEAMAFQAAAAQNNALLYKMAQEEVDERARAEQLQNALYRISQTVHTVEDLGALLKAIHSIISEVLPASSFYFSFYDPERNLITFPYFNDDFDSCPPDRKPGKGLTEFVLNRRITYLWRANQSDPTEGGAIEVLGKDAAVWLGVPLVDGAQAIGVMAVQHYDNENAYGDRERQILDFVAAEVARAITAMRAVKSIRESEDKYRSLIENTREGIFLWSNGRLELVNQPICDLFGYNAETLCSQNFDLLCLVAEAHRSKVYDRASKLLQTNSREALTELNLISSDGREIEAEVSINTITYKGNFAVQGIVRDVSHRRTIEAQLLQSAKLEAIGRLAGGVAHDFNNLLTALTGTAELMLLKTDRENPNYADIEQILTISRRGSNLTQQLLAFARSQPQKPKVFQLNSIVQGTEQMLRRLIGDSIKLALKIDPDLPAVKADPAQLEMALMNLIVNSRDAMAAGGIITIATAVEKIDEESGVHFPGVNQGEYCVLSVSDQGTGMSREVLDRATDPFFTTKPIGKGTGLGLSTVHGIARQSGGILKIFSQLGAGTTVKLYIPVSSEPIPHEPIESEIKPGVEGMETILVCDDEDTVRQVAVRILQARGYSVLEAIDGQHALEVAESHHGTIDLLLTDMAMPVMSGPDLADHLRKKLPALKVIMMSGYSPMAFPTDFTFVEPKEFIQKPFRARELNAKVREVLDQDRKSTIIGNQIL